MNRSLKNAMRVARSILFATTLTIVGLLGVAYVVLSIPAVQDKLRGVAEQELHNILGSEVKIGKVLFAPFNELRLYDVEIKTPQGEPCLKAGTIGAGITLWKLIALGRVEITFAELVELNGNITQAEEGGPLNIQFIIDAFAPKDPNRPPSKIDISIRNIVIRKSNIQFNRLWVQKRATGIFDPNHLQITNLRADILIPVIRNDEYRVEIRHLAANETTGLSISDLKTKIAITEKALTVAGFELETQRSKIKLEDIAINYESLDKIAEALQNQEIEIQIKESNITPADFSSFYAPLAELDFPISLLLSASGTLDNIKIIQFKATAKDNLDIRLAGAVQGLQDIKALKGSIADLHLQIPSSVALTVCKMLRLGTNVTDYLTPLGTLIVDGEGAYDRLENLFRVRGDITTDIGSVDIDGGGSLSSALSDITAKLQIDISQLDKLPVGIGIGSVEGNITGNVKLRGKRLQDIDGDIRANIGSITYHGQRLDSISVDATKQGMNVNGHINSQDRLLNFIADVDARLTGQQSSYSLNMDIARVIPSVLGLLPNYPGYEGRGEITADISGDRLSNLTGNVIVDNLYFGKQGEKTVAIEHINLSSMLNDDGSRRVLNLDSPVAMLRALTDVEINKESAFDVELELLPYDDIYGFFNIPVKPLSPLLLSCQYDGARTRGNLTLSAPYLLQGEKKLIKDTRIDALLGAEHGLRVDASATLTGDVREHDVDFSIAAKGLGNNADAVIGWKRGKETGEINLSGSKAKGEFGHDNYYLAVRDSRFSINGTDWHINPTTMAYDGKRLAIGRMLIGNGPQFVEIKGNVGPDAMDIVTVDLAGVDLDYIFETININFVTFGGKATGRAVASGLLGKTFAAKTERLHVDNFSYNGAVVGQGELEGYWDATQNKIGINGEIWDDRGYGTGVKGGVWLKPDSLNFDFYPKHVNLELVQPFLKAFCSKLQGEGSGHLRLFGPSTNIDLEGRVKIDTLAMTIGFTDVTYYGSDSLRFDPGVIEVPRFKVYDGYGGSAYFGGRVDHDHFKEANVNFDITNARKLLCLDLNATESPVWYGRVFANGGGKLRGQPGVTTLDVNVVTAPGSEFTFVLDDSRTAGDYPFLSFVDTAKQKAEQEQEREYGIEDKYRELAVSKKKKKELEEQAEGESVFILDLGVTVTPESHINLIMDPNAGDKIRAEGDGAMRVLYNSIGDDIQLFGKYTIERGNYNFSLQDLFLRDFAIEKGSGISFNGDPLAGILDITAAYRVNTNLADLDKSFETDPDLNRTSVPVDAKLIVTGDMRQPDIAFDVALPTVTPEVESKVRSIISTEEEMQRQVIYLLVLSKFYTPDYMGGSSGGEWASVASSTLSSQLGNVVSSLTDKVWVNPSFKSESNDFSDVEVDLALSSRLLDNRLIINGNLGYRDRSISQTTFIGDFDIEYLLNKRGNIRLKAYNHFNDANYYLRSSTTTQGLGVIYKTDFDNLFSPHKRKKNGTKHKRAAQDTIVGN